MTTTSRRLLGATISCALLTGLLAGPAVAEDARLGDAVDPTIASVELALDTFEPGTVDVLVLGRNDQFADSLGGSALAGYIGGPLLLTDGGPDAPLRPEVRDAIAILVNGPASQNCDIEPVDVYVLGGENAVSSNAVEEIQINGFCPQRLAGDSRFETALQVANEMRARGASESFMVARADNFADSAAAGAIGALMGEPILLTPQDSLHSTVLDYVYPPDEEEGNVFQGFAQILGGTGAISQHVQDELTMDLPANSVGRIAGATRDETSVRIAERVRDTSTAVGLVNGFADDGWVYALIGGAIAPVVNGPIVYVQVDSISDPVVGYLDQAKPASILVFGPVQRVSDATAADARVFAGDAISK